MAYKGSEVDDAASNASGASARCRNGIRVTTRRRSITDNPLTGHLGAGVSSWVLAM